MVSPPSVEQVAENVLDAVTSLDIDSFHGRAGKQPWGYGEPTEAAWELPPRQPPLRSLPVSQPRPAGPAAVRRPALAAPGGRRWARARWGSSRWRGENRAFILPIRIRHDYPQVAWLPTIVIVI
jgi:hypothetical protein